MSDSQREDSPSVADSLRNHYPKAVLAGIFAVMLWIRLRSYDRFIVDGEVFFSGNDAWYHLRQVNYTVRNWPFTMPFDPWTGFPYGVLAGQFGTLYDQLIATAALILGLGDPSQMLVGKTLLVAPAVFGALTVIPTYLIGKRLGGRIGGLFGAIVLMLLPGTFLRRGLVGFADHNVAEPLFMALAVFAMMVALTVAARERPIWELVAQRDTGALRRPTVWSVVAGLAVAAYMAVWPPGILLVGIVGVYFVLQMVNDSLHGESPEHVAYVAAVSMAVTTVIMVALIEEPGFGVTGFSLLQPLLSLGVGAGAVVLAALARAMEGRDVDESLYPAAVGGLILVSVGLFAIVLPSVFDSIAHNLLRTVGFSAGAETRTIGEAQPFLAGSVTGANAVILEYGFTFFTGLLAIIWLTVKPLVRDGSSRKIGYVVGALAVIGLILLVPALTGLIGNAIGIAPSLIGLFIVTALIVGAILQARYEPERLFVLVWLAFITAAAFTQVRFNYYLAVGVAVANAYLIGELVGSSYLGLRSVERVNDVSGYQVLAVVAAILLILAPALVVPISVSTASGGSASTSTAWQVGNSTSPGEVLVWEESLEWMNQSTPAEGNFGGAGNADQLQLYESYEYTEDFDYPEGAYGVMSWWDYGHWITVEGERIPNANPFQQGATTAANFLLAPNESQARDVLASQSTEGEQTRYVMVDWKMVTPGSKFSAPTVFYDAENISQDDFFATRVYRFGSDGSYAGQNFLVRDQRYYDSLMTRLYYYHGSSQSAAPVVLDWEPRSVQTGSGTASVPGNPSGNASLVRQFDNMSAARQFVERDGTAQVGGIGGYPEEDVPALQHYRLVHATQTSALTSSNTYLQLAVGDARAAGFNVRQISDLQPVLPRDSSWVKTFERVPGATVQGSGAPADSTVTASVRMQMAGSNSTFTYTQEAQTDQNGEFTMTLPYSTTGYDEYGPENGYTDVNVRAAGPYTISTGASVNESGYVVRESANLSVPEGQVNGAQNDTLTVELERSAQQLQTQTSNSSSGASGNASASGASETATESGDSSESSDTSSDTAGTPTASGAVESPSLVAPDSTFAAKSSV
ncbi:oligosaccharyl transferase, archaeosortase A system-associated [Halogeometricum sp. S1BR25-6]|uniref:dolichyl-phosphooligosaccharide-protein glycotransferase n=1 Tax=Halogeometricum salsisoli TaxID=2950536 RepID=A0ABU2GEZ3_9EURY|nr:oligosaccharyl transferase, archaeosortase A system-associated [Halogeometricum sp. S1BR25-6]MDS0298843.1 oligosaccharyl transferase, archaeosortase A system-associated [Halogeometricum sp. S1BR25-6]